MPFEFIVKLCTVFVIVLIKRTKINKKGGVLPIYKKEIRFLLNKISPDEMAVVAIVIDVTK